MRLLDEKPPVLWLRYLGFLTALRGKVRVVRSSRLVALRFSFLGLAFIDSRSHGALSFRFASSRHAHPLASCPHLLLPCRRGPHADEGGVAGVFGGSTYIGMRRSTFSPCRARLSSGHGYVELFREGVFSLRDGRLLGSLRGAARWFGIFEV